MARHTLAPGEMIGERYVVDSVIARGGMATVYRVRHVATGVDGALKLLLADALVEPELRKRFVQEAQVGARIDSEHVVRVTDAGVEDDGTPWLVMELLDGESLDTYLARRGSVARAEAFSILRQIAHGLGAAHRASVVHRDLKPANVFIARARRADVDATVKLLDFGIASVRSAARAGTSSTLVAGTPGWMAPEQAVRGMSISPAADVWAFGLLAFELLVGQSYFGEATMVGATLPTASARALALGRGGLVPGSLDAWFARCVAIDPARRYSDAEAAFAALAQALGDPARVGPAPRRWRTFGVAALTVVTAMAAFAFASYSSRRAVALPPAPLSVPPPSRWMPRRPTLANPARLATNLVLSEWLEGWLSRVRRADTLRDDEWAALYTDHVNHGGEMLRSRVAWHWQQRARLARTFGPFSYDASRAEWWVEAVGDAPRSCQVAADLPEVLVLRLAAHNGGDEDAVGLQCSPMEGSYVIRARVIGGAPRICAEAWSACASVCARCPRARGWRCCGR